MNFEAFQQSLTTNTPPANSNVYLQSLWHDAKDDWEHAHTLIQDLTDKSAAWIHAYLHRKEGDRSNAAYWYTRAGKSMPFSTLEEEWRDITAALL